jgi:glycosyltransferase involved in cell wall biosynthesis
MATVVIDARDASDPALRGWGRYTRELVAALKRTQPAGIELQTIDRGWPGPELLFEQIGLGRRLRRERAAAVHSPNCFLPLRRPCPGVVTIHDLAFEEHPDDFAPRTRWKYRRYTPRAAQSAERVIADSDFTREDLERRYGIDPSKVRVIPLAPALPQGDAEPPQGPYILAVGDLRAKKNLARLVQAHERLHDDGLPHRLVLAGVDGGELERLESGSRRAPLDLPGYVSDAGLDALMRGAELVVHPSLYEGFGLVLVEAMARGVPVAAANATALPQTAAGAAELFDPRDTEDMAGAIRRVLEDQRRREELIERGRARAGELSWDATAGATAAVYWELL